jgi:uncharacterized protein
MADRKINYLEPGEGGTVGALAAAADYLRDHPGMKVIIASTRGETARKAAGLFNPENLIVVTHSHGFREPGKQTFPNGLRSELEIKGVKVLTAAHAFGGLNKVVQNSLGDIIANSLRIFSQGVKVCVECSTEAADAGLVNPDEDVIAIAGTGKGADTVLVLRPANSARVFETKVRQVLALPS